MPELKSPEGNSPLSQKRVILNSNPIPKIESLDRVEREMPPQLTHLRQPMKVDLNQKANLINPEEKNSSAKIVIWVVIVIVLAIASYLGLKSFLNGPATTDNLVEDNYVTPVVEYISTIVQSDTMEDSQAVLMQSFAIYNNGTQKVGADSTSTFDLFDVSVQKYESFTRLSLGVNKIDGDGSLPLVTASYDKLTNEITVDLMKTTTLLEIPYSKDVMVGTDTVDFLTRVSTDNTGSERFVIKLSQPTIYLLQVSSSSDSPTIYLDIKEVKTAVTDTPVVTTNPSTTVVATPIPSATPVVTLPTEGEVLDNEFSKNAQTLLNGLTTNTASLNGLFYSGINSGYFVYKAEILPGANGKMPNVTAKLEGTTLTVVVTNLLSRNATADINIGDPSVQKVNIVSAGNTRTYTFTLNSSKDYKISYKFNDTEDKKFANALWIQVKH